MLPHQITSLSTIGGFKRVIPLAVSDIKSMMAEPDWHLTAVQNLATFSWVTSASALARGSTWLNYPGILDFHWILYIHTYIYIYIIQVCVYIIYMIILNGFAKPPSGCRRPDLCWTEWSTSINSHLQRLCIASAFASKHVMPDINRYNMIQSIEFIFDGWSRGCTGWEWGL